MKNDAEPETHHVSVIMLGLADVGKTSIIMRFKEGKHAIRTVTASAVDIVHKIVKIDENNFVKLHIWDTAGQERFDSLSQAYYGRGDVALIVYDVTNDMSFKKVRKYVGRILIHERENEIEEVPIYLVANKIDSVEKRRITKEQGEDYARRMRLIYKETSAADEKSTSVDDLFLEVISERYRSAMRARRENVVDLEVNDACNEKKKCKCFWS